MSGGGGGGSERVGVQDEGRGGARGEPTADGGRERVEEGRRVGERPIRIAPPDNKTK